MLLSLSDRLSPSLEYICVYYPDRNISARCLTSLDMEIRRRQQSAEFFPNTNKTKNNEKAREGGPNGQECMRNSLKTEVNHIKLRRKNIILSRDFVKKFRALNRAGKSFV